MFGWSVATSWHSFAKNSFVGKIKKYVCRYLISFDKLCIRRNNCVALSGKLHFCNIYEVILPLKQNTRNALNMFSYSIPNPFEEVTKAWKIVAANEINTDELAWPRNLYETGSTCIVCVVSRSELFENRKMCSFVRGNSFLVSNLLFVLASFSCGLRGGYGTRKYSIS